jgi:hypothetical protein
MFWFLVTAVSMGACTFGYVNHVHGWDNKPIIDIIKIPIYVNLKAVDGNKDNMTVDNIENWVYFKNLEDIEWGYADYQRNLLGWRMDVQYAGENYPQCMIVEVNDVSNARYFPDKLEYIRTILIMCDTIEEYFEEALYGD